MRTGNDPGNPAQFFVIGKNSPDGFAHGGRDLAPPPAINRRVQVAATDHPATDRWITLTTVCLVPPLFRVGVVDGHSRPTQPPRDYPTLLKARTAANRLYAALTEENHQ